MDAKNRSFDTEYLWNYETGIKADWLDGKWSGLTKRPDNYERGKTSIKKDVFKKISKVLTTIPNNFKIHKSLTLIVGQIVFLEY